MIETNKTYANTKNLSKRFLLETIDFLRFKVENDSLTTGECDSIARLVSETLELQGTVDDFARFYGKSRNNVKVVICRKLTVSPVRKVLYPFAKFCRVIPRSWYDGIGSQE